MLKSTQQKKSLFNVLKIACIIFNSFIFSCGEKQGLIQVLSALIDCTNILGFNLLNLILHNRNPFPM